MIHDDDNVGSGTVNEAVISQFGCGGIQGTLSNQLICAWTVRESWIGIL